MYQSGVRYDAKIVLRCQPASMINSFFAYIQSTADQSNMPDLKFCDGVVTLPEMRMIQYSSYNLGA